eukprot:scaffold10_cov257-Pinguiococcus_pyrenoidosus.AAC.56
MFSSVGPLDLRWAAPGGGLTGLASTLSRRHAAAHDPPDLGADVQLVAVLRHQRNVQRWLEARVAAGTNVLLFDDGKNGVSRRAHADALVAVFRGVSSAGAVLKVPQRFRDATVTAPKFQNKASKILQLPAGEVQLAAAVDQAAVPEKAEGRPDLRWSHFQRAAVRLVEGPQQRHQAAEAKLVPRVAWATLERLLEHAAAVAHEAPDLRTSVQAGEGHLNIKVDRFEELGETESQRIRPMLVGDNLLERTEREQRPALNFREVIASPRAGLQQVQQGALEAERASLATGQLETRPCFVVQRAARAWVSILLCFVFALTVALAVALVMALAQSMIVSFVVIFTHVLVDLVFILVE